MTIFDGRTWEFFGRTVSDEDNPLRGLLLLRFSPLSLSSSLKQTLAALQAIVEHEIAVIFCHQMNEKVSGLVPSKLFTTVLESHSGDSLTRSVYAAFSTTEFAASTVRAPATQSACSTAARPSSASSAFVASVHGSNSDNTRLLLIQLHLLQSYLSLAIFIPIA